MASARSKLYTGIKIEKQHPDLCWHSGAVVGFFKRLFGQPDATKRPEPAAISPCASGQLPAGLEKQLQDALSQAAEQKTEARFLTAERLRPVLACVAKGTTEAEFRAALNQAGPLPVGYWLLLWPLLNSAAAGQSTLLHQLVAGACDAFPAIAEQGNVCESFAIFLKKTGRQGEMQPFSALAAKHAEQCAGDARALGRAAMILSWLGKRDEASQAFEQALKLADADQRVLQMVREGKVLDSWYPASADVRSILAYWQRANP